MPEVCDIPEEVGWTAEELRAAAKALAHIGLGFTKLLRLINGDDELLRDAARDFEEALKVIKDWEERIQGWAEPYKDSEDYEDDVELEGGVT